MIRATRMGMQRIDVWHDMSTLSDAFALGLKYFEGQTPVYLFEHIYAPVKIPTSEGMPDEFTYIDVGLSTTDIAEIYWSEFSGNFWPEFWTSAIEFRAAATVGKSRVVQLMKAVVSKNLYKYKKLIELQGYSWHPLWNVDGTESFSSADIHSDETETSVFKTKNTHKVATYDGGDTGTKTEYTDTSENDNAGNTRSVCTRFQQ